MTLNFGESPPRIVMIDLHTDSMATKGEQIVKPAIAYAVSYMSPF